VRWLARFGLGARGVVYAVIGVLAAELALGVGGKTASQRGAMVTIAREPAGKVLLIVLAAGLAAYAVWRLVSAGLGPDRHEEQGAGKRTAAAFSGIAYAGLCFTAIEILAGASTSGGASSPKHETAGVLGWPEGRVLVAIVGVVLIIVGLVQAYRGLARKFLEDSRTEVMSRSVRRAFTTLGVAGHLARAVVFALVGYGITQAAINYSAHSAIGLDGALEKLSRSSDGPLLLGIVAAGLICFGLFSIWDARYRRA
jgi:uncharacterized membrane protein